MPVKFDKILGKVRETDRFDIDSLTNGYVPKKGASGLEDSSLYVTSGGYVGIGTTSPIRRLHLPNEGLTEGLRIGNADLYDAGLWFRLDHNGIRTWFGDGDIYFNLGGDSDGYGKFYIRDSASVIKAWIDSSGNARFEGKVGIGSISPSYHLHIYESTTGSVRATIENPSGQASLALETTGARWIWYVTQANGNQLRLWDGVNNVDRITVSGSRVGIGTTSPSYDLHVNGNAFVSTSFTSPEISIGTYYTTNSRLYSSNGYIVHEGWNGHQFYTKVGTPKQILQVHNYYGVRVNDVPRFLDNTRAYYLSDTTKTSAIQFVPFNEFARMNFVSIEYFDETTQTWQPWTTVTQDVVEQVFSSMPGGARIEADYTHRKWRVTLDSGAGAPLIYGIAITKTYTSWHTYPVNITLERSTDGGATWSLMWEVTGTLSSEGTWWLPKGVSAGPYTLLRFTFDCPTLPTDGVYRIGWIYGNPFNYAGRTENAVFGTIRRGNETFIGFKRSLLPMNTTINIGRDTDRFNAGYFNSIDVDSTVDANTYYIDGGHPYFGGGGLIYRDAQSQDAYMSGTLGTNWAEWEFTCLTQGTRDVVFRYRPSVRSLGVAGWPSYGHTLEVLQATEESGFGVVGDSTHNNVAIILRNQNTGGHHYALISSGGSAGIGQGKFGIKDYTAGGVFRLVIDANGNVGIGATSPTAPLDVAGDRIRIEQTFTPTSTADTSGNVGDICWDDNYLYIKTSQGWKRVALSTF